MKSTVIIPSGNSSSLCSSLKTLLWGLLCCTHAQPTEISTAHAASGTASSVTTHPHHTGNWPMELSSPSIEFEISSNALKDNKIQFTKMHCNACILNHSSANSTEKRKRFVCLTFPNILCCGLAKSHFKAVDLYL